MPQMFWIPWSSQPHSHWNSERWRRGRVEANEGFAWIALPMVLGSSWGGALSNTNDGLAEMRVAGQGVVLESLVCRSCTLYRCIHSSQRTPLQMTDSRITPPSVWPDNGNTEKRSTEYPSCRHYFWMIPLFRNSLGKNPSKSSGAIRKDWIFTSNKNTHYK